MLKWTLIFFLLSIIAGLFGYTGIAGQAAGIAKVIFTICLTLFVVSLVVKLIMLLKIIS